MLFSYLVSNLHKCVSYCVPSAAFPSEVQASEEMQYLLPGWALGSD